MHSIEMDQIYRSCIQGGPRIRITEFVHGAATARVLDADTHSRPREIHVTQLHPTDRTRTGSRRRTGYALEVR